MNDRQSPKSSLSEAHSLWLGKMRSQVRLPVMHCASKYSINNRRNSFLLPLAAPSTPTSRDVIEVFCLDPLTFRLTSYDAPIISQSTCVPSSEFMCPTRILHASILHLRRQIPAFRRDVREKQRYPHYAGRIRRDRSRSTRLGSQEMG